MQIDFHHAVTYVTARIAGFGPDDAEIIAYAAQYVDDATHDGVVWFNNSAMYQRASTAHRTIDLLNLVDRENLLVWLPFHFLPGNGGLGPQDNPAGTFIDKIICLPDSPIAQAMVAAAIAEQERPYSLHRLGISMHVYADTWAHQGFAGVIDPVNAVREAEDVGYSGVFPNGLHQALETWMVGRLPLLGHAQAQSLPDMPFLIWEYTNGRGQPIRRRNTDFFCAAADALCRAMQRYRQKTDPTITTINGLGDADKKTIRGLFKDLTIEDANQRHAAWLKAIAQGKFSFGPATITYDADGPASWKMQAIGTTEERLAYPYRAEFLTSHWKMFHDAAQAHRLTVLHDILPQYGICAG